MSHSFPYKIKAIKVSQPFGDFFITSLPANLLLEVTYPDPLRIIGQFDKEGIYPMAGIQRKDSLKRLSEIGKFIDSVEAVFPTPVILAANYNRDGYVEENPDLRWKVSKLDDGTFEIEIPTQAQLASIVDGQHRLLAFSRAEQSERKEMELACSIFFDLPNPYQAYLFATVNFNQRKVSKSLAFELYGFDNEEESPEAWTPDKTAVFLCRKLNTDSASPFYHRVIVSAQEDKLLFSDGENPSWRVSTATVVEGILRLFSRAPKDDRALMFKKTLSDGRSRTELSDDGTPLRNLFLQTNDLVIYEIIKNYFLAVQEVFWANATGRSYIIKTVGIQALFEILRDLAKEALEKKIVKKDFFKERIASASAIDFSDNFFQASGQGRVRIRNAIKRAANLIADVDLPENDREQYLRFLNTERH